MEIILPRPQQALQSLLQDLSYDQIMHRSSTSQLLTTPEKVHPISGHLWLFKVERALEGARMTWVLMMSPVTLGKSLHL